MLIIVLFMSLLFTSGVAFILTIKFSFSIGGIIVVIVLLSIVLPYVFVPLA